MVWIWSLDHQKPDDVYNLQRQLLSAGFIFLIISTKSNKYVKLFFILWKHYNKLNYFIVKERLTAAEARGTKEIIRFYMFFCMYYVNNNGPYKLQDKLIFPCGKWATQMTVYVRSKLWSCSKNMYWLSFQKGI